MPEFEELAPEKKIRERPRCIEASRQRGVKLHVHASCRHGCRSGSSRRLRGWRGDRRLDDGWLLRSAHGTLGDAAAHRFRRRTQFCPVLLVTPGCSQELFHRSLGIFKLAKPVVDRGQIVEGCRMLVDLARTTQVAERVGEVSRFDVNLGHQLKRFGVIRVQRQSFLQRPPGRREIAHASIAKGIFECEVGLVSVRFPLAGGAPFLQNLLSVLFPCLLRHRMTRPRLTARKSKLTDSRLHHDARCYNRITL